MNVIPVILCGGSGTRLWPLSRQNFPKQFINLVDDSSLFKQSLIRVLALENKDFSITKLIIVSNENHRFLVLEQIEELSIKKDYEIILEPEPKNTAPALTLAAISALQQKKDSVMVVIPSDHYIRNQKAFVESIHKGILLATDNTMVIFGVPPSRPEPGYGYIEYSKTNNQKKDVINFVEKPDINLATKMLESGDYAWNSGMFILTAKLWIDTIKKANSKIYKFIDESFKNKMNDNWFIRPDVKKFRASPADSIDYAVMENAKKLNLDLKLLLLTSDWNDLGTFNSLDQIEHKDKNGNVFKGDVVSMNSNKNIVFSSKRNISLLGVDDLIIVDSADSILIANKNNIQDIKALVSLLEKKHKHLLDEHIKVNRPWGSYSTIDFDANFKVKRIIVKPNSKLSYQSHNFRSEHWVVVKGLATILCDGNLFDLHENESTFIKKNSKHQLINNQNHSLEIIEIQIGEKVIEEDITRFDDIYGRS